LKNFLILLALVVTPFSSFSQNAPAKAWDRIIGGVDSDLVGGLMQTPDGGYILGSYSKSGIGGDKTQAGRGMEDYWVVKVNANGIKTWDKTFGGNSWDYLSCIQPTSDGGYIMGGTSLSDANGDKTGARKGNSDIWIIKLDANGNKVWDKTIGGDLGDGIDDIQQTSDGGYILGGSSVSSISFDKSQPNRGANTTDDYWIIKLDALGNKLWDKTLGGSGDDNLRSVKQTLDGGYILGGESESGISGEKTAACRGLYDYWIVKVDGSGNKQWDKTFGGNINEKFTEVQQTADGGYIVGGYSPSPISGEKSEPSLGSEDLWILKLDSFGNKVWDKTIGTSDYDWLYSLQQTQDGGYILGSRTESGISGHKTEPNRGLDGEDFWLVKLNAAGNKLWDKAFGGNYSDILINMRQTTDGGFIMAGNIYYSSGGDVTGTRKGGTDLWLVKTTADPLGMPEFNDLRQIQVYPNPSNGELYIAFLGNFTGNSLITITDLLGRKILERSVTTTQTASLQLPEAKGIYMLQIADKQGCITKRIIVE
jgi:hypothetical protein